MFKISETVYLEIQLIKQKTLMFGYNVLSAQIHILNVKFCSKDFIGSIIQIRIN